MLLSKKAVILVIMAFFLIYRDYKRCWITPVLYGRLGMALYWLALNKKCSAEILKFLRCIFYHLNLIFK